MRDALAFVGDLQHGNAGDGPGVAGLPPGGGIKGGAVEVDGAPVFGALHDARSELAQVGIGVVEAAGHGDTAIVADGGVQWRNRRGFGYSGRVGCFRKRP